MISTRAENNLLCWLFVGLPVEMFGLEYIIVKDNKKTWTDAQADCEQRGYNLTSVMTEDEATFLKTYV